MLCTQCCCCLKVSLTPPCWWRRVCWALMLVVLWTSAGGRWMAEFSQNRLFSACFPYSLDTKVCHVAWRHWDTTLGIRMFSSCFSCRVAGRTPVSPSTGQCVMYLTQSTVTSLVPLQTELFFNGLCTFHKAQCPAVSMCLPVCTGRKYWCWLIDLVCSHG